MGRWWGGEEVEGRREEVERGVGGGEKGEGMGGRWGEGWEQGVRGDDGECLAEMVSSACDVRGRRVMLSIRYFVRWPYL